ncbi:hypothetical protein MRS76_05945 [Rhizobiaceae bacterium n13]|uniref:Uncharacterized protein n=1 Tax=Ferirhizobium litorale TaxID=2927786 RepID=A0AAE3Q9C4_9HYPH|nr:hypothetical protein [Fererhizobium litorale]MDI7861491.1 hypothetical protein [Fererhizobium litorale]MDI7921637.1 hypothetical protein [Fererhizobium litorale]
MARGIRFRGAMRQKVKKAEDPKMGARRLEEFKTEQFRFHFDQSQLGSLILSGTSNADTDLPQLLSSN